MPTATVWCAECDWALADLPQPLAALLPRCFSCHSQPLVVLPHMDAGQVSTLSKA